MFIAALFTIAKTGKQPKCPQTDEWIKNKMWYVCVYTYTHTRAHTHIYIMEHYLAIKQNEIMPSAAMWMDLEIIILRDVSKRKINTI